MIRISNGGAGIFCAGPAKIGARGRMRPAAGPAVSVTVVEFEPDRTFTNSSTLPGARLVFEHRVGPETDGATVEVIVRVTGVLTPLWRRILGRSLQKAAHSSVSCLLRHLDTA